MFLLLRQRLSKLNEYCEANAAAKAMVGNNLCDMCIFLMEHAKVRLKIMVANLNSRRFCFTPFPKLVQNIGAKSRRKSVSRIFQLTEIRQIPLVADYCAPKTPCVKENVLMALEAGMDKVEAAKKDDAWKKVLIGISIEFSPAR